MIKHLYRHRSVYHHWFPTPCCKVVRCGRGEAALLPSAPPGTYSVPTAPNGDMPHSNHSEGSHVCCCCCTRAAPLLPPCPEQEHSLHPLSSTPQPVISSLCSFKRLDQFQDLRPGWLCFKLTFTEDTALCPLVQLCLHPHLAIVRYLKLPLVPGTGCGGKGGAEELCPATTAGKTECSQCSWHKTPA